jgi:hypothetical protein
VTSINREEGLTFAQVMAAPMAALDRGREVLLISTVEPLAPETDEPANDEEVSPEALPE